MQGTELCDLVFPISALCLDRCTIIGMAHWVAQLLLLQQSQLSHKKTDTRLEIDTLKTRKQCF